MTLCFLPIASIEALQERISQLRLSKNLYELSEAKVLKNICMGTEQALEGKIEAVVSALKNTENKALTKALHEERRRLERELQIIARYKKESEVAVASALKNTENKALAKALYEECRQLGREKEGGV